jgi:RNA polymerase sigma factor (sigma-70 family)
MSTESPPACVFTNEAGRQPTRRRGSPSDDGVRRSASAPGPRPARLVSPRRGQRRTSAVSRLRAPRLRDPAPWLATIAKRVAIDVYRREKRRPARALEEVAADEPALVNLPPDLDVLDAVWHVRRAIDALPPVEATIVRLQHLDGLTHNEISDELGIALGTVKSRSHRAHRRLAALLGHLRSQPHD